MKKGKEIMDELEFLRKRVEDLEKENRELKKLLYKEKRKVGRKAKFEAHDIEAMKFHRLQGKSFKEIAELYSCSVGLVHKLIATKK